MKKTLMICLLAVTCSLTAGAQWVVSKWKNGRASVIRLDSMTFSRPYSSIYRFDPSVADSVGEHGATVTLSVNSPFYVTGDRTMRGRLGICYSASNRMPEINTDYDMYYQEATYIGRNFFGGPKQWTMNVSHLLAGTTYYYRPYLIILDNVYYGAVDSITTQGTRTTDGELGVDMGLSVKWAKVNVGASKPEDYGYYYAWGETETKQTFTQTGYKFYLNIIGYSRYCRTDSVLTLVEADDAAYTNSGGLYRMPTHAEMLELTRQCQWNWCVLNGVQGMRVTGPTGEAIFLPAAGYKDTELHDAGTVGYYWTASLYEGGMVTPIISWMGGFCLQIAEGGRELPYLDRYKGALVRPVVVE